MKSSRHFKVLAKSSGARMLVTITALMLVFEPYAFALQQYVSKYPTGYVIGTTDMGQSMTLERGSVFGFNSAKSASDTGAFTTIEEAACATPATLHAFTTGKQGFVTTGSNLLFSTIGTDGYTTASGAAKTVYSRSTATRTFQWNKKFLWDCGTPSAVNFSMAYKLPVWNNPNTGATPNYFQVFLVRPDNTTVNLNVGGSTQVTLPTATTTVAWTPLTGTVTAANFNLPGVYTLRISGQFDGASNASDLQLLFDDVNLTVTSGYTSFSKDVEFTMRATPYSSLASNQYLLDVKARKKAGDAETTDIQVWATGGGGWVTRYSVTSTSWNTFNTYYLSANEYNNGYVRVRYIDAQPSGDTVAGGVEVDYQRVTVDQGSCVDEVRDIEADCGKCHNYGGDVTKPWPNAGKHYKHAQSESIADCLWCHPDNGLDSAHKNNVLAIAGTKLWGTNSAGISIGNPYGAPANATYDGTTGRCSNLACHMNQLTPSWNAVYATSGLNGNTIIARNCSRCHNSGSPGADSAGNLNINVAWPSTGDGGGHSSHNAAVAFDEYSCQGGAASCHPDNRGQHTVVGDGQVVVKMAPIYKSPNSVIKWIRDNTTTKGAGTCSNVTCHGGQTTPKFNAASSNPIDLGSTNGSSCIMCHQPEEATGWGEAAGNASQYNSPISGLHRGSPQTSGQDHAAGLQNGCMACHTTAGLTRHFQFGGATNLDTTAMDTVTGSYFWASMGYGAGTGVAPNYTSPPTCMETAAGCHAESITTYRNPTTVWQRRWSWDAYDATPGSVKPCNNCHGHWAVGGEPGFVTGVVQPHIRSNTDATLRNTLINNHTDSGIDCATMCHGQGGGNYNHGVMMGAINKDMSINANAGFTDRGTVVECVMCHSSETPAAPDGAGGNHFFADATWLTTTMVTGSTQVTCYNPGASANCHGDGVGRYWGDDTPNAYPNRNGKHTYHLTLLANRLGLAATWATSDTDQKRLCQYCHPANPGASGHADMVAPADITGVNPIWDTTNNPPTGADNAPAASFNNTDASCSGIDCHNNQTTGTTWNWRTGGATDCMMCHTVGAANTATTAHPSSGLHNAARLTGMLHDNSFTWGTNYAASANCVTCHTTTPTTSNGHINGTNNYSIGAVGGATRVFVWSTSVGFVDSATRPTCSPSGNLNGCHIEQWNATTDHTWTRVWATTAAANNGTECANCHGTWTQTWATGVRPSHTANYDGDGNTTELRSSHRNGQAETEYSQCISCHVYNDTLYETTIGWNRTAANKHGDGLIQIATQRSYNTGSNSCANNCHDIPEVGTHGMLPDSGWTVQNITGPALSCGSCHASIVSHTDADGAGGAFPTGGGNHCLDCHTDHATANRTGTSGANNIYIPTWSTSLGGRVPTMNKAYTTATHNGYIQLGGTATANATYTYFPNATTEAHMCWGCHGRLSTPVSEWGTNQDAKTGNSTYNFGDMYTDISTSPGTKQTTANWTTGFWRSGKGDTSTLPYWYKRGSIQSTHAVNFDSGTVALTTTGNSLGFGRKENKDAVQNIRCSYCHDVHGTHNGVNGDTSGGAGTLDQPYLRGTWRTNPYAEDGAPQLGQANWALQGTFGAVPRASASATNTGTTAVNRAGGFWIDQNSANPTSGLTATGTSGLCEQCHGSTKNGTWATAALGTLNWSTNGTGEANIWVSGYNGHANSVLNGPGRSNAGSAESYARNIFTRAKRGTTIATFSGNTPSLRAASDLGLVSTTGTSGWSYRGQDGLNWQPSLNRPSAFKSFAWGTPSATASGAATYAAGSSALHIIRTSPETASYDAQANYHTFTCSKCHTPHASRLPKLMITNCLDTNHNTWEDNSGWAAGTALPAPWTNTRASQFASAQNCHRLDARAPLTSGQSIQLGAGWNRVTPWLEFTSPNATRANTTPNITPQ